MVTKAKPRVKPQPTKHKIEVFEKRMVDCYRHGGMECFAQWVHNPINEDPNFKFICSIWGSIYIASNDKPIDLYMTHDRDSKSPVFCFVAGKTPCDVVYLESKDATHYEIIRKAIDLLDVIFLNFYTKPS